MGLRKDEKSSATSERNPTQAQLARLYAIAKGNGWTDEGVHNLIWANFRIMTTKDLTIEQYNEVVAFVETAIVPNVVTLRRDANTPDLFE